MNDRQINSATARLMRGTGWEAVQIGETFEATGEGMRIATFDMAKEEEFDKENFVVRMKFADLLRRLDESDYDYSPKYEFPDDPEDEDQLDEIASSDADQPAA